jgi:hypothetical protein
MSLWKIGLACAASVLAAAEHPTFNRDVLPILEKRCQECHRPGEVAPMPFLNYRQTRPWVKAIREAVVLKKMPPWFAEPGFGPFSNDRSLSKEEIDTLVAWADSGAPEGDPKDRPPVRQWPEGWNVAKPDMVVEMPAAFAVPAKGAIDYQYIVVPTGFSQDKWVRMAELRPSKREIVHHAVVYIREPGSKWMRDAKPGVPYVPPGATPRERLLNGGFTTSDILLVYSPGNVPENWPAGLAKLIPAGSDLVFQMHYTPNGHATADQSRVGLVFAPQPPAHRVITLQMGNDRFVIPPGHPNFHVEVWGTLPNEALLLSFFPHMHLRGKAFEYNIVENGTRRTLLRVKPYNFYWQLSYRLAEPLSLAAGTKLEWAAIFDNSRNNAVNPDPEEAVRFGEQSWDEMMIGFFDVAIDAHMNKEKFFIREGREPR